MNIRHHLFRLILLQAALLTVVAAPAGTVRVALGKVASALKTAKPGDRIQVEDGVYTDVLLKWNGMGSGKKPVIIEPVTPGGVTVTGSSSLQLSGGHIVIRGFMFSKVVPVRKAVVDFSLNGSYADHCRITDCVFSYCNAPKRDEIKSYIILSGRYNRVDHCSLLGKLNLGVTLLVNLNGEGCLENHHRIDHNYFGTRSVYGSNGAETMRIGTSQQSYFPSNTVVEDNLFERCSGEVEVISVKSCDNTVRGNVFLECGGVVALRHGKRNIVENNIFIGNNKRNTGGVRIVDEGHRVEGNIFYELAGERFFSALGIMNGVPNSLPNRYVRAQSVEIKTTVFFRCRCLEVGAGKGSERTEAPTGIVFDGNRIINKACSVPLTVLDDGAGLQFRNNEVSLSAAYQASGFRTSKLKAPSLPSYNAMHKDRGASWYDINSAENTRTATAETIRCGGDIIRAVAAAPAGSTVVLTANEYVLDGPVVIDKPLVIRSEANSVMRYAGDSPSGMLVIADGGSLDVSGITFDGALQSGKSPASSAISTAAEVLRPYRLRVDSCVFKNFGESGFSAIKGTKTTFADSVTVTNSLFCDNSGNGIDFSAERDDKGRYNAEDVIISNCTFRRFLGIPVNIYRGGSDESTAGPKVTISGCLFDDCCNRQRGSVLRLIGPQNMDISGCTFNGSGRGGASIRLDETSWEKITVRGCTFNRSGRVMTSTDNVRMTDNKFTDR